MPEENDIAYQHKAAAKVKYGLPGKVDALKVVGGELITAVLALASTAESASESVPDEFTKRDLRAAVGDVWTQLRKHGLCP